MSPPESENTEERRRYGRRHHTRRAVSNALTGKASDSPTEARGTARKASHCVPPRRTMFCGIQAQLPPQPQRNDLNGPNVTSRRWISRNSPGSWTRLQVHSQADTRNARTQCPSHGEFLDIPSSPQGSQFPLRCVRRPVEHRILLAPVYQQAMSPSDWLSRKDSYDFSALNSILCK